MVSETAKPTDPEETDVTIKVINPDGRTREYVNYARVNHGPNEFTVDFCDIPQPYDEDLQRVLQAGAIEARIKYRIACTPAFMEKFIFALAENYRKYKEKQVKRENGK